MFFVKASSRDKNFFYENIKLCVLDGISNNVKKIFHLYYEGENTNDQYPKTYIVIVVFQANKTSNPYLNCRCDILIPKIEYSVGLFNKLNSWWLYSFCLTIWKWRMVSVSFLFLHHMFYAAMKLLKFQETWF